MISADLYISTPTLCPLNKKTMSSAYFVWEVQCYSAEVSLWNYRNVRIVVRWIPSKKVNTLFVANLIFFMHGAMLHENHTNKTARTLKLELLHLSLRCRESSKNCFSRIFNIYPCVESSKWTTPLCTHSHLLPDFLCL